MKKKISSVLLIILFLFITNLLNGAISSQKNNASLTNDAVLLVNGGNISGHVSDESANGILNVSVQAYTSDSTTWMGGSVTDANGDYEISELAPGNYKIYFYPPAESNYVQQWYSNRVSSENADPVAVIADQTTSGINAQLMLGGAISGRVTDESNSGILDVGVAIYANNSSYWGSTNADGYYTVHGIPAGSCKVFFYPANAGNYIQEWYNNKNSQETADNLNITPGQTINNIDAQLDTGCTISGRVTNISDIGIPNVQVTAQDLNTNMSYTASSDGDGNYEIFGIKSSSYKLGFFPQNAVNYVTEWYNDKNGFENADVISLADEQKIGDMNAQLAEGGIISGRVTDESDNGLKDISIYIYNLNNTYIIGTSTDNNGYYSIGGITNGQYKIFFRGYKQNYVPEWYNNKTTFETADPVNVTVGQTTPNINAQLAIGGMISGQVTNALGSGIQNVSANVYNLNNDVLFQHCHTDELGNYTIYGIPGGTYKINFSCYGMNYLPEWYNDKSSFENADQVIVTVGQTLTNINAQLIEGGIISGTVTDTLQNPLENIRVDLYVPTHAFYRDVYTNAAGQYVFQGLPSGTYKIYFYSNGQYYLGEWYNDKNPTYENADALNVIAGQTLDNINAQLLPGGNISGTVSNSTGEPLDLVNITIYDTNNQFVSSTNTNPQGYYLTGSLPPGNYKILFSPPYGSIYVSQWYNDKFSFADANEVIVSGGQTTERIDAQLRDGGVVTGTVTDLFANPIQNINVRVYLSSNTFKSANTDAEGKYEVSGLPTGSYKVNYYAGSTGYCSEWYADKSTYTTANPVAAVVGQMTPNIDAQLILGGVLSGRVSNESANGIQSVRVRLYDLTNKQVAAVTTNSSGNYNLVGILPGSYRVYFDTINVTGNYVSEYYNDKFAITGGDIINIISGQTTTIDAVLSPGGIITGRVTDTGGNGILGVQVAVRDAYSSRQYKHKYTDSSGNYSVQGIPGVACKVYFNTTNTEGSYVPEWYNNKVDSSSAEIFAVSPGQTFSGINATLASGGTISGRITDATTNLGIPEMEVYAYDLYGNLLDSYGYADENGDYTLKGLPTGNYKINFETYYYNMYYATSYNDYWYNTKNSIQTADNVPVTAGQITPNINAALTVGGGIISGRVTDENGVGIPNTIVYVLKDLTDSDYWDNQTDSDGYYQVSGITEGSYHVYFLPPTTPVGYAPQIYNGKAMKSSTALGGDWVQVTDGNTTPNINAVLTSSGTVTGRVTNGNGNGLPNIRVRLYSSGNDYFTFINASTDYYGNYTIYRVPPGQLKAYFSSSESFGGQYRAVFYNNKQSLSGADTFTVQAGVTTPGINAVMTTGGGTISGYVRFQNGQPINGATVELYDLSGIYSFLAQITTNSSGYFEFKGTLPGMYKLNASCKNIYASEWYNEKANYTAADIINVNEGGTVQVEITLGETNSLQVTSPNGGEVWDGGSLHAITWSNTGPVGDVKIEYSTDNGITWTEIVSAIENSGNYNWIVPAVPSSNCKIRISGPGGVPVDTSDAVFTIFANPAGWIPVIGMQNNMVVYGKAYHGITQAAAGDWIGAFGPGGASDCRGVAVVGADGNYYMTIRSDASSGETITFKLWPNPSGPAIDASETVAFLPDNIYAAFPLHFGPRTQIIPLMAGWNWISFNTLPADTTFNSVFAPVLGSIEQVKNQGQAAIYSGGSWIGDLANMSGVANGIMYKVKATQTCTLSTTGLTIPFNQPLPVIAGWNWVAYLPGLSLPVESALNSIMSPLSQTKSQTQSAVKVGDNLMGDLMQMEPNKGYTIKANAPGLLVYPYTAAIPFDRTGEILTETNPEQTVPWKTIKGNQYNMVAFGKVYLEGQAVTASGCYLVSQGPNGERDCRAVSPIGTDGNYFSTILGNTNGETIKFKLFDSVKHKTYEIAGSLGFQSDDLKTNYDLNARSIRVTAPAGDERLDMGSIYTITWNAYNVTNVKIELYKNGKSLSLIAASLPASAQTYSWTIPTRMRAGNNYQIKITAVDPGILTDGISNGFSIVPIAGLTLNYPIASEIWQVKRSYDITWGSTGITNVKIELYKGVVLNTTISESTPADAGKFSWTVPTNQVLGSDYKIKISSVDAGVNLNDMSKSSFSIVAYKNTGSDFDGDGRADLIWRYYGSGGYNCLWLSGIDQEITTLSDPRQAPQATLIQDEANTDNKIVGTGDFNNDGKEDILWRNKTDGSNFIWNMNGTTFAGSVPLPAETNLAMDICGTGDFNNDGKPDIIWRDRSNGSNKIWLMDGVTKTGELSLTSETNQAWDIAGAEDFDNNGKPDILWHNTSDGSNRIWIMDGNTLIRTEPLPLFNTDWEIVSVLDYDGNRKPDIAWRNKVNGKNSVWLMDGLSRQNAETLTQVTDITWKLEN